MDLEGLVDAYLAGEHPEVPEQLRRAFERAVAAHEALRSALDEDPHRGGPPDRRDRPPPKLPGDYELVCELGRGGMGVVYLMRQCSLGRHVAVKVLLSDESFLGSATGRFAEEARHLARLRHPNIVSVHEFGLTSGGEPYLIMDYIEGEPLTSLLLRGPLTPSRALAILRPSAEAVRHAHEQGLIHRDLKPGNILVDGVGTAFVTDFGLARNTKLSADPANCGERMGTPAYMAPEQARDQPHLVGEATDVHALGVVFYEMLTGRPPYGQGAVVDILTRLLYEEPTRPRKFDRRIPHDLETICLKAMAKEPSGRYPTVTALLDDIRRFDSGLPPRSRQMWLTHRALRAARRHYKPLAAAAAIAVVAIVAWAFVMPSLAVDQTVGILSGVANRHHLEGDHLLAARFYIEALNTAAEGPHRDELLRSIGRCVAETTDPDAAVLAARAVLGKAPGMSFGRYNRQVARATARHALDPKAGGGPYGRSTPLSDLERQYRLELAVKRLDIQLDDPRVTPDERIEAERLRSELVPFLREAQRDASP